MVENEWQIFLVKRREENEEGKMKNEEEKTKTNNEEEKTKRGR